MRLYLITVLVCLIGQTAFSQTNDTTRRIDELFAGWNNATPGGAIAITRGDNVLYNKAWGLANMEGNIPNTTETIFECGSVSKQFTAFAVLLLEADGKLSITDDVRKYIPELPVYEAPITIQHLFNHTSGLKDWGSILAITGWPRGTAAYTNDYALKVICQQKSLNFKPGAEYSYSNSNYTLLVHIVARVSKQSHADFTTERIFKPLGMTKTKWRNNFREVIPGRAQAYGKNNNAYELIMPFENTYGHGGLLTTTSDLLKWNKILETHQLGGKAVFDKRIKQGILNDGKTIAYATGIEVVQTNGLDLIQHSGSTAGYRALLVYYPKKKVSVVMLSNDAQFNAFNALRKIEEVYYGKPEVVAKKDEPKQEPVPAPFDPKSINDFVGNYFSDDTNSGFKIVLKDGKLEAQNLPIQIYSMEPKHKDAFTVNSGDVIEFKRTKGVVTGFNYTSGRAMNVPFKKVK